MKLSDFDFFLPPDLIAQYPLPERTHSRLLVVPKQTSTFEHRSFFELVDLLKPDDLLIFNNTRVMSARLYGQKATGGKVEILIERVIDSQTVIAHMKASKALHENTIIKLTGGLYVKVLGRHKGLYRLACSNDHSWDEIMEKAGHMPLPPYIQRTDNEEDLTRYQTVYAKESGAIAAPTAGLHFDDALMDTLKTKGVNFAFVTLHVGSGTFKPVRVENISEHQMHSEYLEIDETTCVQIRTTKEKGGRVIAVGTTSVRCLETAARDGVLKPYRGETNIFIYPGYEFKVIDGLITNFHLPKSSLLMLVSAFAGYDKVMAAYREAIAERYRFFSYGDAMLLC